MESSLFELKQLLDRQTVCIAYTPFPGEIDPWEIPLFSSRNHERITVPQDKSSDPVALARTYQDQFQQESVYILIPGTQFDANGTRHGRGGGWFDRFLSVVPQNWIRIGLTPASNFSLSPLPRKEWDQPVDWILVNDNSSWIIHRTEARHAVS